MPASEHDTAPPPARTRFDWTPEQDARLGTASDGDVALLLGRSISVVQYRRAQLGIPAYRGQPKPRSKPPRPPAPPQPSLPFRIIVAGNPDFRDYAALKAALDAMLDLKQGCDVTLLVRPGVGWGADSLAVSYAQSHGLKHVEFPLKERKMMPDAALEWDRLRGMLAEADAAVLAFDPHGDLTQRLEHECRLMGIPVTMVGLPRPMNL